MLTGWEREELLGRKKFVYEVRYRVRASLACQLNDDPPLQLFENQSVVEYWENFANHAFENTTQSVYSHCVLLKPSGVPVPCTFCFSIRRDIMDLPSLVIGTWPSVLSLHSCSPAASVRTCLRTMASVTMTNIPTRQRALFLPLHRPRDAPYATGIIIQPSAPPPICAFPGSAPSSHNHALIQYIRHSLLHPHAVLFGFAFSLFLCSALPYRCLDPRTPTDLPPTLTYVPHTNLAKKSRKPNIYTHTYR